MVASMLLVYDISPDEREMDLLTSDADASSKGMHFSYQQHACSSSAIQWNVAVHIKQ